MFEFEILFIIYIRIYRTVLYLTQLRRYTFNSQLWEKDNYKYHQWLIYLSVILKWSNHQPWMSFLNILIIMSQTYKATHSFFRFAMSLYYGIHHTILHYLHTIQRKTDKYFADLFTPILGVLYKCIKWTRKQECNIITKFILQETTQNLAHFCNDENRLRDEFS